MTYAASTLCQRFYVLPNIFPSPTYIPVIIGVLQSRKAFSDVNLIHVSALFRIFILQPLVIDFIYQNVVLSVT